MKHSSDYPGRANRIRVDRICITDSSVPKNMSIQTFAKREKRQGPICIQPPLLRTLLFHALNFVYRIDLVEPCKHKDPVS